MQSLTKTNVYSLTCGFQRVINVSFWEILLDLFSCNHHFNIALCLMTKKLRNENTDIIT